MEQDLVYGYIEPPPQEDCEECVESPYALLFRPLELSDFYTNENHPGANTGPYMDVIPASFSWYETAPYHIALNDTPEP